MASYRYVVRGRVQGVGYRYFVAQRAQDLGVAGYVRNQPDGSVEVIAEGGDEVLGGFEDELRRGPSFSRVERVERVSIPPRGDSGFHIR